jgi:hypothetical protein
MTSSSDPVIQLLVDLMTWIPDLRGGIYTYDVP